MAQPSSMHGRTRRTELINVEAEQQYLAWLLLNGADPGLVDRIMADRVTSADFWSEPYARVFGVVLRLAVDGQPVTSLTVRDRLEELGALEAVGGHAAILAITDTVPFASHASLIRRLAAQRRLQNAARIAGEMIGSTREAESLRLLEVAQTELLELRRERDELVEPCAAEPMRGCPRLRQIAVMGVAAIRALAAAPIPYAWDDVAVAGTIVLLAGGPSEGKTTLLFLLLAARASVCSGAVHLLGRDVHPAPAGRYVLLIEGEHSEGSTARKLISSLDILGVSDRALERVIIVARKSLTIGSPEWTEVVAMVRAGLISDIAIDTIARCSGADANDEAAQVAIYRSLADCIEAAPNADARPTVWLVAHTRKGAGGELADVSGSAQRVGQADSVLLVRGMKVRGRTVSSRVSFAKLRETPDVYPEPVEFALVRDAVDGRMSIQQRAADAAADEAQQQPTYAPGRVVSVVEQVANALRRGPLTKRAIRSAIPHLSDARVSDALFALQSGRRIVKGWATIDGRKRQTFQLVDGGLHAAE